MKSVELLSEYGLMITKPNQMSVIRIEPSDGVRYVKPTRWEVVKNVLSQLGEYAILGLLYLIMAMCYGVGLGLLLELINK